MQRAHLQYISSSNVLHRIPLAQIGQPATAKQRVLLRRGHFPCQPGAPAVREGSSSLLLDIRLFDTEPPPVSMPPNTKTEVIDLCTSDDDDEPVTASRPSHAEATARGPSKTNTPAHPSIEREARARPGHTATNNTPNSFLQSALTQLPEPSRARDEIRAKPSNKATPNRFQHPSFRKSRGENTMSRDREPKLIDLVNEEDEVANLSFADRDGRSREQGLGGGPLRTTNGGIKAKRPREEEPTLSENPAAAKKRRTINQSLTTLDGDGSSETRKALKSVVDLTEQEESSNSSSILRQTSEFELADRGNPSKQSRERHSLQHEISDSGSKTAKIGRSSIVSVENPGSLMKLPVITDSMASKNGASQGRPDIAGSRSARRGSEVPESLPASPVNIADEEAAAIAAKSSKRTSRPVTLDPPQYAVAGKEPDMARKGGHQGSRTSKSRSSPLRNPKSGVSDVRSTSTHRSSPSEHRPSAGSRKSATPSNRATKSAAFRAASSFATGTGPSFSSGNSQSSAKAGQAAPVLSKTDKGQSNSSQTVRHERKAFPLSPSESSADETSGSLRKGSVKVASDIPDDEHTASQRKSMENATQSEKIRANDHESTQSSAVPGREAFTTSGSSRQQSPAPDSTEPDSDSLRGGSGAVIIANAQSAREVNKEIGEPRTGSRSGDVLPPTKFSDQVTRPGTDNRFDRDLLTPDSTSFQSVQMSSSKSIERTVGQHVEELQSDNEHWIQQWLLRARHSANKQTLSSARGDSTDVFSKLKPLVITDKSKKQKHVGDHASFTASVASTNGGKLQRKTFLVPRTTYTTSTKDVPSYSHYVSIRHNILAPNETTLQHWPYFGDDFDIKQAENLHHQYYLDVEDQEKKLHRLGLAEQLARYAEDMLRGVGCQWSDVLRFLLDPKPAVGLDVDAQKSLAIRDSLCKEDFTRTQEPWTTVLAKLPQPEPVNIGKAALLCEHFLQLTSLSLWQVARRSDYVNELIKELPARLSLDELTCRVCMRLNCPYHGEIELNGENEEGEEDDSALYVVETDIVHPPDVNNRTRIGFIPAVNDQGTAPAGKDRRALRYWQTGTTASLLVKPDDRGPFYPCHHPGLTCEGAHCSCYENKTPCEKTCSCPQSCTKKFLGCNCAGRKKGQKRVCFEDDNCTCFQLGRECDPDLCGECGVCEVLDPVLRDNEENLKHRCSNASIQRGIPKHTILGDSVIHGLGLFACETIREHDFVGEYTGEIITKSEAERRGAVYEHQRLSYLFSLNRDQEIDGTYFGNKTRYINHAAKLKANLYPRIIMCNTVHRIALYAQRRIGVGEELFFDYGPMFPDEQLNSKTQKKAAAQGASSKAAPHVRNTLITKDFYDLDVDPSGIRQRKSTGTLQDSRLGRNDSANTAADQSSAMQPLDDSDVDMDGEDSGQPHGNEDAGYGEEGWTYDVLRYNVVEDDANLGRVDSNSNLLGPDDDDFEPDDLGSGSDAEEEESESEEDNEPLANKKRPKYS